MGANVTLFDIMNAYRQQLRIGDRDPEAHMALVFNSRQYVWMRELQESTFIKLIIDNYSNLLIKLIFQSIQKEPMKATENTNIDSSF